MTTVASLTIEMAANVARLQADMGRAANTVQSATAKMQKAAETAGRALGAIGAGLTVAAFTGFIRGAINAADETSKLSQKIGVTVKDVAGLQLAFRQAGVSQEAMATGLARLSKGIAEGNDGLKSLGIATKNNDGTLKTSRQVLAEVADQFAKTGDGATKTARAQEIFGKTGADLIPLLNAGSRALEEYDALASKLGLTLSDETAKQAEAFNDTLDLVGQGVQGVGRQIAGQLLPTLTGLASEFFNTVSSGDNLKKTADFLAAALKGLYSAGVIGVEIFSSLGKTLGGVAAAVVAAVSGNFKQAGTIIGDLQSDVGSGWKDALAQVDRAWNTTGDNTVANLAQINKAQMTSTKSLEDGKKAAQEYAKFLDQIRGKVAELSGVNADYIKNLVELDKARKNNVITEAQYVALVEQLIAKQPSSIKLVKDLADAEKLRVDAINESYAAELKRAEALEGTVDGLAEQNAALKNEIELIGLTERAQLAILQARNETIILTKEATLAELERASATTGTQTRIEIALKEEIRLLRDRNKRLGKKLDRTEAANVYDSLQAEGKRFYEDLERGLTDSLFRAFESGRGFFKTLWDGIRNLFQTTVLRLAINGVVGGIGGGLGTAAQAATGGGGLSSLGGIGSAISTLGGSFGSSLSAGFSASLQGGFGVLGTALEGGLASIATASSAGIAGGLGQIAGALGPYAIAGAGLLAVYNYFKSKEGGPKTESGFGPLVPNVGDPTAARAISQSITAGYTELARELGIRVGDLQVGVLTAIDSRGKALTQLAVEAVLDGQTISSRGARLGTNENVGRTPEALTAAVAEEYNVVLLEALKRSNLRDDLRAYLDSYVASGLNPETAIDNLQLLAGTDRAFAALGLRFSYLTGLSLETQQAIVGLAGGLDAFVTNLATYEQNFYTEAERSASTLAAVGLQLSALNLMLPTTREGFRALVEAQDLTTEAGQRAYTTLLAASGAFASAVPAIEATANAAAELASTLRQSLSDALDAARSNTDAAYAALERATDAQRRLAQEQIDAISGVISAIGDNVRSLYNEVDSTRAQSTRQGAAFIAQALATAQLTGYLPDGDALSQAIGSVRGGFNDSQSAFEAARDRLVLAGQLSQLSDIAGTQLTEAERTLKALDDGLALAQAQIDAVRGVDNSVLSVADAVRGLSAALVAERAAAVAAIAGGVQGVATPLQDPLLASNPAQYGVENLGFQFGANGGGRTDQFYLETLAQAARANGFSDIAAYDQLINPNSASSRADLYEGIPFYEQGTSYVPRDGLGYLHQGEAVLTRQENSQRSGDMTAEIRSLKVELSLINQKLERANEQRQPVAEAFNGQQRAPLLTEAM